MERGWLSFAAATISCAALLSIPASSQTLPEIAREHGGSAGGIIDIDGPVGFPAEMMSVADLVMRGRVAARRVHLNADESHVVTEYTIEPLHVLKQRGVTAVVSFGATAPIVVQHTGGSLTTADGLRLSTSVNIYPESETFRVGEEVFVFLDYNADSKTYRFTYSAFGAYRIQDGVVRAMTREAAARRNDQAVSVAAFVEQLERVR